jgi:hypothetical protein
MNVSVEAEDVHSVPGEDGIDELVPPRVQTRYIAAGFFIALVLYTAACMGALQ